MAEYNNKVQLQNGIVLIDLTQDTVTEETLGKGVTAHDRTGKPIVGTMEATAEDLTAELTEYSALNAELESVIDSLPSAGGGSGMETCEVTIVQRWGMNDDPDFLHLYVPYYKVLSDGSIEEDFVYFTSVNDFEAQHSVTFIALKNVPINVVAFCGFGNAIKYTTSATGGEIVARQSPDLISVRGGLYTLTPTANTATFTFASA